jgi:hypothetical protein
VSSERYINRNAAIQPLLVNGFKQDYLKGDFSSHVGGALAFGPDEKLYVSTGDGTSFNYADPRSPDVLSLSSLSGKILRIDPMTGAGLPDNPYMTTGLSLDTNQAKVFQLGYRNPFSMAFDAEGRLFVTNTGWFKWETLNMGGPGASFGWPYHEGGDGGTLLKAPYYQDFATAGPYYSAVQSGSTAVTPAFRAFSHSSADPGYTIQAITGGEVIYDGTVYPSDLRGDYFFADFVTGDVFSVDTNNRANVKFLYSVGYNAPVDFTQGPDGRVYYADIVMGQIGRLEISDQATSDADGDGLSDTLDRFALDATNGGNKKLAQLGSFTLDFSTGGTPSASGFTGTMANGTQPYTALATSGSVAGGKLSLQAGTGDPYASLNSQQNAYQFGIDTAGVPSFTVTAKVDNPFVGGVVAQNFRSVGLQIGAGDQDNYAKVVFTANGASGGVEFLTEVGGEPEVLRLGSGWRCRTSPTSCSTST